MKRLLALCLSLATGCFLAASGELERISQVHWALRRYTPIPISNSKNPQKIGAYDPAANYQFVKAQIDGDRDVVTKRRELHELIDSCQGEFRDLKNTGADADVLMKLQVELQEKIFQKSTDVRTAIDTVETRSLNSIGQALIAEAKSQNLDVVYLGSSIMAKPGQQKVELTGIIGKKLGFSPSGSIAVASAAKGGSASGVVASTQPTTRSAVNRPVRDKWALICGISNFADPTIPHLKYPSRDARDFYNFLVREAGFAPDHIRLLLDEKATQRRILTELGDKFLPRVASPDDLVVFYFSGHGSPGSVDVRNKNYLVCYDTEKSNLFASGIEIQDLAQLVKTRVQSDRVLLILDACHSGSADASAKDAEPASNFNADQIAQGSGQLVICSSEPNEQSWESKRYNNGVFTRKLIDGLKLNGKRTSLGDAFNFLKNEVSDEVRQDHGVRQTPVLRSQWSGHDIVLSSSVVRSAPLPQNVQEILLPDSSVQGNNQPGEAKQMPPGEVKRVPVPVHKY